MRRREMKEGQTVGFDSAQICKSNSDHDINWRNRFRNEKICTGILEIRWIQERKTHYFLKFVLLLE